VTSISILKNYRLVWNSKHHYHVQITPPPEYTAINGKVFTVDVLEACRGSRGITPVSLYLVSKWRWVVSLTPLLVYLGIQCIGGWEGPRAELDGLEGMEIPRPCQHRNSRPPDPQTALLRIRKPYPAREIHFTSFHRISLTPRLIITIPTERNNKTIRQYTTLYYRGAAKSLARPGRKQTNFSVRMVWISFGPLPCRKKKLDDSSRLDVVEITRVPDLLPSLFPSWSG